MFVQKLSLPSSSPLIFVSFREALSFLTSFIPSFLSFFCFFFTRTERRFYLLSLPRLSFPVEFFLADFFTTKDGLFFLLLFPSSSSSSSSSYFAWLGRCLRACLLSVVLLVFQHVAQSFSFALFHPFATLSFSSSLLFFSSFFSSWPFSLQQGTKSAIGRGSRQRIPSVKYLSSSSL